LTDPGLVPLLRQQLAGLPVHELALAPSGGEFADFPDELNPALVRHLQTELEIERLFAHQAEAIGHALGGCDVAISSGTSSGKTLCYTLPILQSCLEEPVSRALLLYPTKALAQDQLSKILAFAPTPRITAAVYDGDTPQNQRSVIRNEAQIILSNPDMLHVGILPNHANWRKFFRSLRWIVLDEIHTYRGSFGSHAAWVLRRLLRLCAFYGSRPRIIGCSATIPNMAEHFQALTGREPALVDRDTAPHGEKRIFLVEAPDEFVARRESPNVITGRLLTELSLGAFRSLAFCRARVSTELVVRHARRLLAERNQPADIVESYRGGYTPKERREIEKLLFQNKLRGLATTSAMEMGVDIGGLDAVIINGYPGTMGSFWQQAGRAGRSGRFGAVVFIAHEDPLEQHLVRDPSSFLRRIERAAIAPDNPLIAAGHLKCAAHEKPLEEKEMEKWPQVAKDVARDLVDAGELSEGGGRLFYPSYEAPASKVNLRGSSDESIRLFAEAQPIGEMERWRAYQSAFPGAVYLHRDRSYVVASLDLAAGEAFLEEREPGYYTQPITQSYAEELVSIAEESPSFGRYALSSIELTTTTVGARKKAHDGGEILADITVNMPSLSYQTLGVIFDIIPELLPIDDPRSVGALHGAEHALAATAPLVAGCDQRDLGSVWFAVCPETMGPRVVIYDAAPGGLGFAQALFEGMKDWLAAAAALLEGCPCEEGCPRCLLRPNCEANNDALNKPYTIKLLRAMASSISG
jgi:DEAD/DEAH box helicase domain-containing protein